MDSTIYFIVRMFAIFGFLSLMWSIGGYLGLSQKEATENNKRIEYGMLIVTILSVFIAGVSLYQSMQTSDKLHALELKFQSLQGQTATPSAGVAE